MADKDTGGGIPGGGHSRTQRPGSASRAIKIPISSMRTVDGSSETLRHESITGSNSKCATNGNYLQVPCALFSRE